MRAMIWNLLSLNCTTLDDRPPLKNHCGYESQGGEIEAGTFTFTATTAGTAVAITGATTTAAVFYFQDNNRRRQDGARDATNCCRRRFTRQQYEELRSWGVFYFQADIGVNPETMETNTSEVTARQKFARLPMSRQQQEVISSGEQNNLLGQQQTSMNVHVPIQKVNIANRSTY